jgi:carbamoylphosphate synthase large subunit
MPKRTDIKRVLIIGSGPIVIGQACEFDYSGSQACKALRAEGLEVILVNSNPATIMTDPELADRTYVEPLTPEVLAQIIERERPDALLPTVGGQTALNLAVDLANAGILEKFKVEMIGASIKAIKIAEDRQLFKDAMREIGLEVPQSGLARTPAEALELAKTLGFPLVIRPSFTLGGIGGGIAYNIEEFRDLSERGLELSPVHGPHRGVGHRLEKFELEVMRDVADNFVVICSIEEHRSDGRAHRRQHHRRAHPHADRQGIPADARRRAQDHQQGRRRNAADQHPVCGQPRRRPDGRHRDEPARLAIVGAGVEATGFPIPRSPPSSRSAITSTRSPTTSPA